MAQALIFDSGVGGLSVAREIQRQCPDLRLFYVADDAYRPYGDKSDAQLQARLPPLLATLTLMLEPDILVIACNTASTIALAQIREAVSIPVIGVVPAIKPAALKSQSKHIAVLGTPGTVKRPYVDDLITQFAAQCQVILQGSVALVAQAEAKLAGHAVDHEIIKTELAPIFAAQSGGQSEKHSKAEKPSKIDAIVLACTHFPLLLDELRALAPYDLCWIDSGAAIAKRVETVLQSLAMNPDAPKEVINDSVINIKSGAHHVHDNNYYQNAPLADKTHDNIAFLIGPNNDPKRAQAFHDFGFAKVVGLLPD